MEPVSENQTQIILDSIADGVFTVDAEWRITSFNNAAERITGIRRSEALGRHCWEVFRASICEQLCAMHRTLQTGKSVINQSIFIVNADGERVPVSISTALLKDGEGKVIGGVETFRDLSEVEELRKELVQRNSLFDIVSKNKSMQKLFDKVELVAESEATILIEGESGTGKELFARAIHARSHRKNGPLVTVNCGAMPDTLLESELFGYKKGAFTDAKKDKPGRLALAAGGTLFLDEIGDISPMLQVRLLRVLQERTFEPLGGVETERADVRVVAATNRDLKELVAEGRFREDLFYRINVIRLRLPPLRERREDIPLLVRHFIRASGRNGNSPDIDPEALDILVGYDYPGNVRELESVVQSALNLAQGGTITVRCLQSDLRKRKPSTFRGECRADAPELTALEEVERHHILRIYEQTGRNKSQSAKILGIGLNTLRRKLKAYGFGPEGS